MKLVRNITPSGMCKYSLIEHEKGHQIEHGFPNSEHEFFVIKLKDRHSHAALLAYALSIKDADPEFAKEIGELSSRAGRYSPWCKEPD